MVRALITGGTGFVGSHLTALLRNKTSRLAVLASTGCGDGIARVDCYEVDIRDAHAVRRAIHEFQPDHVYHLAAVSSVEQSWESSRLTYEANVLGTLNVLDAAMNLASPPRILNVSTGQVYAPSPSALTEGDRLNPDNPYAASKAMAELLRVPYRKHPMGGIITARSFNHAGPGQSPGFVFSSIAKQFAEIELGLREAKISVGNTHVRRDFTDVRDVVRAYNLLLEKGAVDTVYNVCSGRSRSIREIIEGFESVSGIKVAIDTDLEKVRSGENNEVCGSPAKLRAATGWEPQIPLETTMRDLLSYWRSSAREPKSIQTVS